MTLVNKELQNENSIKSYPPPRSAQCAIQEMAKQIRGFRDTRLDHAYPVRWHFILTIELREGNLFLEVEKLLDRLEYLLPDEVFRDKFDSLTRSEPSVSETEYFAT